MNLFLAIMGANELSKGIQYPFQSPALVRFLCMTEQHIASLAETLLNNR